MLCERSPAGSPEALPRSLAPRAGRAYTLARLPIKAPRSFSMAGKPSRCQETIGASLVKVPMM